MKLHELFEKEEDYKTHSLISPDSPDVKKSDTPEVAAAIIEHNCSEFLEAYKKNPGNYIYRGIKDSRLLDFHLRPWVGGNIRQDRKPLYLDTRAHDLMNNALTSLGLKAHRGNSLFCTTNLEIAEAWGNIYVIFLKDGWSGTIFEDVKTDYAYHDINMFYQQKILVKQVPKDEQLPMMIEFVKGLNPKEFKGADGLNKVIKKKYYDIIITGSSYVALEYNNYSDFRRNVFKILDLPEPKLHY